MNDYKYLYAVFVHAPLSVFSLLEKCGDTGGVCRGNKSSTVFVYLRYMSMHYDYRYSIRINKSRF